MATPKMDPVCSAFQHGKGALRGPVSCFYANGYANVGHTSWRTKKSQAQLNMGKVWGKPQWHSPIDEQSKALHTCSRGPCFAVRSQKTPRLMDNQIMTGDGEVQS
jgi:hypothetical protein